MGVTVQGADEGDTTTIQETLPELAKQLEAVATVTDGAIAVIEEIVAEKAITAAPRCTIWRRWRFAPTSANLIAGRSRGLTNKLNETRSTRIDGAPVGIVVNVVCRANR